MPAKMLDLTGDRFGRLVVVRLSERINGAIAWECICDCGSSKIARAGHLRSGEIQSCNCLKRERQAASVTTHGEARHSRSVPEYYTWQSAKSRCYQPSHPAYRLYGARGIRMCDAWLNNYEAFLQDVGRRPGRGYSLDRINVNGDYEPGNCRWVTAREQSNNRRCTTRVDGVPLSIAVERAGLKYNTVRTRMKRGWSVGRALTTKP